MLTPLKIYTARKSLKKGDAARDSRSWPDAVSAYRKYVQIKPRAAHIWVQLGHALKESGVPAEAEAAYRQALQLRPTDSDIHLQLGHLLKISGRREEAIGSYRDALALDPLNRDALGELIAMGVADDPAHAAGSGKSVALRSEGDAARDAKNWAAAATAYRSYVELVSEDAGIWVQLGHVLREAGRFEEAELAYSTAVGKAPELADAWHHFGRVLKLMGRWGQAEEALRKAAELGAPVETQEHTQDLHVPPAANVQPKGSVTVGKEAGRKDEKWLLIESQSRALRAMATELVRLRSDLSSFASRMTQLEAQAVEREKQLGAQIRELSEQLLQVEQSSASRPLNPLFNHLRASAE